MYLLFVGTALGVFLALTFSLSLVVNPSAASQERPGHYEKPLMSAWRGVL